MPGIEKLHLDDALEDAPQTRSLLGVFEKDASILKKYTATMQQLCSRILGSQREMCAATQALAVHLRSYEKQKFALESDDSILSTTLQQFSSYLDEISSLHQILATQLGDSMMYPLNKFLQADLDEVVQMSELYKISGNDHEQALTRYMKFPKKKEGDQRAKQEISEDLYIYRRKFHQRALHLFSSLNGLQYKRKMALLEPMIGFMQAQKGFFDMSKEAIVRQDVDEFLCNISASVQGVQAELNEETNKSVEMMDSIEKNSTHLYHADIPAQVPFTPPNLTLGQKAGYLYLRSKAALISTKWERCYFFIQGGNLMCQQKDEVAGGLLVDLNLDGTTAEPADIDDRRNTFQVISRRSKRTIILQAENIRERDEWVATINNVVLDGDYISKPDRSPKERSPPPQTLAIQPRSPAGGAGPLSSPNPMENIRYYSPTEQYMDTAVAARFGPSPTLPSTPAESGFFPDAPISFDLATPTDQHKSSQFIKEGPPKRINPFDQATDAVMGENMTDNAAFCQTFNVRFLGSMAVRTDRGEQLVHETIRQIMAARAIHNVFKMTESLLVISNEAMRLVDPASKSIRSEFSLEDISFWAVHKENKRLFGYISRTKSHEGTSPSFACHVFECNTTGEEICQAIHHATKLAFQVLMRTQAVEEQKFIEQQILLANIQQLPDIPANEQSSYTPPSQSAAAQSAEHDIELAGSNPQEPAETKTLPKTETEPSQTSLDKSALAPAPVTSDHRLSTDGKFLLLENQESDAGVDQSAASIESPDVFQPVIEKQEDEVESEA